MGIVTPEIGPRIFGTFEKQTPGDIWLERQSAKGFHNDEGLFYCLLTLFEVFLLLKRGKKCLSLVGQIFKILAPVEFGRLIE